jgi:hypothetical protein
MRLNHSSSGKATTQVISSMKGNATSAKMPKIPLTSRGAKIKAMYVRRIGDMD